MSHGHSSEWEILIIHTYKCNMRQLFAIPVSYKNNTALAKPEGRYAHARMLSLFFGSHFLPWPCNFVQLSFFSLFLLFGRVLLSARSVMLTFSAKGKAYLKRLAAKREGKRFRHFLASLHPTLCLGSPRSIALFCSFPFCVSFSLPLFSSLIPSVCA